MTLVYIRACDPASALHLAARALDQHRRSGHDRDVARRGSLRVGSTAGSVVAHTPVQSSHLRRQRRIRPGDRREKPPQRQPGRSQDRPLRGQPRRARRHPYECAGPDLRLPVRAYFRLSLDAALRAALPRLLRPTRALQGSPLPRLAKQRGLRPPARLRTARPRQGAGLVSRARAHGVERGQAHLRRCAGRG